LTSSMAYLADEKTGEFADDVFDRKLDPGHEFVHNFPRGYPTLAERYTERSKELHIHFSFCDRQYCAVFYRPIVDEVVAQLARVDVERGEINGSSHEIELPVLLPVSKTIEKMEKVIRTVRTHSLVRLKALDLCLHRRIHSGNLALDVLSPESALPTAYWETSERRGPHPVGTNEVAGQVVENTTKVVQGVTESERKLLGRRTDLTLDAPRMLQAFSLEIVNNYTWLRATKVNDVPAKGLHVLVRPYLLGLKASKRLGA
jgi:hypothetical protein